MGTRNRVALDDLGSPYASGGAPESHFRLSSMNLCARGTLNAKAFPVHGEDMSNLRMASGREAGANDKWIPGGKTAGGVPEGVLDLSDPTMPFTFL